MQKNNAYSVALRSSDRSQGSTFLYNINTPLLRGGRYTVTARISMLTEADKRVSLAVSWSTVDAVQSGNMSLTQVCSFCSSHAGEGQFSIQNPSTLLSVALNTDIDGMPWTTAPEHVVYLTLTPVP